MTIDGKRKQISIINQDVSLTAALGRFVYLIPPVGCRTLYCILLYCARTQDWRGRPHSEARPSLFDAMNSGIDPVNGPYTILLSARDDLAAPARG